MNRLTRRLLHQNPVEVARQLIGLELATWRNGKETAGTIVETEAYASEGDPASHAHHGPSKRNEVMFGEAGRCYVYLIYGMHHCVNVVTGPEGIGSAVLIRALEPTVGIETMIERRGASRPQELTKGPARLCAALAIDFDMLGEDMLDSSVIRLRIPKVRRKGDVASSVRIGITKAADLPWRFFLKGSPFVSGPAKLSR